jgi:hypothetical protein
MAERIDELRYNLQLVSDGVDGSFCDAFECVSMCSSLVRNTPGPPHKCIALLDEMPVHEFMHNLTPENAWETLLVFAKHLKLCRALQELTHLLVSQQLDLDTTMNQIKMVTTEILTPSIGHSGADNHDDDDADFADASDVEWTEEQEPCISRSHELEPDNTPPLAPHVTYPTIRQQAQQERPQRVLLSKPPKLPVSQKPQQQPIRQKAIALQEKRARQAAAAVQGETSGTTSTPDPQLVIRLNQLSRDPKTCEKDVVALMKEHPGDVLVAAQGTALLLKFVKEAQASKHMRQGPTPSNINVGHGVGHPPGYGYGTHELQGIAVAQSSVSASETETANASDMDGPRGESNEAVSYGWTDGGPGSKGGGGGISQMLFPDSHPGITVLLGTMRQHPAHPAVQLRGLMALSAIVQQQGDKSLVCLAADGGIVVVLQAMHVLPDSIKAQVAGCSILANPAINDQRVVRVTAGCRQLVLAAMARFGDDEQVQGFACLALANLAYKNDTNLYEIAEGGGVAMVIQAMKRYPDAPQVQAAACWALAAFASKDAKIQQLVLSHGGMQMCEAALQSHPAHQGVSKNGRKALYSMQHTPGSSSSAGDGGSDGSSSDEELNFDDNGGGQVGDDEECVLM